MKLSPARTALALLFIFIGCFGTAYAAAGMLTALPAPAVGGTCGPSTASETALEALAEPGSIGAGPEPPTSNATAHHQWQTFVQQCQTLADRRGLASLAIFVASVAVAVIGLLWVLRGSRRDGDTDETSGGPSEWPVEPRSGDPAELVGAGAVIAPPSGTAGTWGEPPVPGYGPAHYPAQQAWAPQPYPYGPPPGYPQQAGYPAPPYPAPPGYAPPGAYPVPPGYAPPTPPMPPTDPAGTPAGPPPPPVATPVDAAPGPAAEPDGTAPPETSAGAGGAGSGPVHPPDH